MNTINELEIPPTRSDALTELGKFFGLVRDAAASGGNTRLPMFSPFIDAAWHQLQHAPDDLDRFCREHASGPVRHLTTGGTGTIEWVAAYEAAYGPLPLIWFTDADGNLDVATRAAYLKTGIVVSDWDCAPAPGDIDPEEGAEAPQRPTHTSPHPQEKPLPGYGE